MILMDGAIGNFNNIMNKVVVIIIAYLNRKLFLYMFCYLIILNILI